MDILARALANANSMSISDLKAGTGLNDKIISGEKMASVQFVGNHYPLRLTSTVSGRYYYNNGGVLTSAGNANYITYIFKVTAGSSFYFTSGIANLLSGTTILAGSSGTTPIATIDTSALSGDCLLYLSIYGVEVPYLSNVYNDVGNTGRYYLSWLKPQIDRRYYNSLPAKIYLDTANSFKIYFKNVIGISTDKLWIGTVAGLTSKYYDTYIELSSATQGTYALPWKIYDSNLQLIESGTLSVIVKAINIRNTTALVIGDSTIAAGSITQKMIDLFTLNSRTITLLGTCGTAPNLHEGRSGWMAATYTGYANVGGVVNAFYNSGFDFSYYMTTQGYSAVDIVVIQLGINDIFSRTLENISTGISASLTAFTTIINSILAYNNSIRIIIDLPTLPNSNLTTFTTSYGTTQLEYVYRNNIINFTHELQNKFSGNANVLFAGNNCVLDTSADISDGVHPTSGGYAKLGQVVFDVINYIQNP